MVARTSLNITIFVRTLLVLFYLSSFYLFPCLFLRFVFPYFFIGYCYVWFASSHGCFATASSISTVIRFVSRWHPPSRQTIERRPSAIARMSGVGTVGVSFSCPVSVLPLFVPLIWKPWRLHLYPSVNATINSYTNIMCRIHRLVLKSIRR
jgi:hypothetical protein